MDYLHSAGCSRITLAEPLNYPRIVPAASTETTAKVIEFASYNPAPRALDELAEPVLDRPRIIEAPELAFPPPALGGILIEPVEEPENERRPGFEIPLQAAPMARRMAASAIDFVLVMSAFAAFAYIFFRFAAEVAAAGQDSRNRWSPHRRLVVRLSISVAGLQRHHSRTEAGQTRIAPL